MGWKPLRTIVLASWDAEEYGLIGSTEWTEDFGSFLVKDGMLPCRCEQWNNTILQLLRTSISTYLCQVKNSMQRLLL